MSRAAATTDNSRWNAEIYNPTADHIGNIRHHFQIKSVAGSVTGQISGNLEYDAFGREVRAWGTTTGATPPPGLPANRPFIDQLPFHFSSKFTDQESGFNYYGYRFYNADWGRWINRDLIAEKGGLNVYAYLDNNGTNEIDINGLVPWESLLPPYENTIQKNRAKQAIEDGRMDMKRVCANCPCPGPDCDETTCKKEVDLIIDSLKRAVELNFGGGKSKSVHCVGGYFCWDWARGFDEIVDKMTGLKCWLSDFSSRWGPIPNGAGLGAKPTPLVHYYTHLRLKGLDFQSYENCGVYADDGFLTGDWINWPSEFNIPYWQGGPPADDPNGPAEPSSNYNDGPHKVDWSNFKDNWKSPNE